MYLIGDVENKNVIILDDIADTCNTVVEASYVLKKKGARKITAAAIHAIFSDDAIDKLKDSPISQFIFTSTISNSKTMAESKLIGSESKFFRVDISEFMGYCIQKLSNQN